MSEPNTYQWQNLECECGGNRFIRVFAIRRRQEGGTIDKQEGWQCLRCNETVNVQAMIQESQRREKMKELERLEAELGSPKTVRVKKSPRA